MLAKHVILGFLPILLAGCAVPVMPFVPQEVVTLTLKQEGELLVEANNFCKPVTNKRREALHSLKNVENAEPVPEAPLLQAVSQDYVADKEFQRNARLSALYQNEPLSSDKQFKSAVHGILQKLIKASPNPNIDIDLVFYREGILASSFPGGVIALNEKSFKSWPGEDQVAFILAHELAHRLLKHKEDTIGYTDKVIDKLDSTYDLLKTIWGGVPSDMSEGAFASSFSALMISRLIVPHYSRIEETQADRLGLDILVRAGYNPTTITSVLRTLSKSHLERLEKRIDEDHHICVGKRYTKKEAELIQELSCKKQELCLSLPNLGIADALDDALEKERLELKRHIEDLQEYYLPPNARIRSYTDYKKAFYTGHKFAKSKRSSLHNKKLSKPAHLPNTLSELQQVSNFTLPAAFSVAKAYAEQNKKPEAEKTITYIKEHFSNSPLIKPFIAGFTREHGSTPGYLDALSSCIKDSADSFHVHPMMCRIGSLQEIDDAKKVVERFREMLARHQISY